MLLLLALLSSSTTFSSANLVLPGGSELEVCTAQEQARILPQLMGCEPRPTVVPLELPNATYVHITPGHVVVDRCGGSCNSRYSYILRGNSRAVARKQGLSASFIHSFISSKGGNLVLFNDGMLRMLRIFFFFCS